MRMRTCYASMALTMAAGSRVVAQKRRRPGRPRAISSCGTSRSELRPRHQSHHQRCTRRSLLERQRACQSTCQVGECSPTAASSSPRCCTRRFTRPSSVDASAPRGAACALPPRPCAPLHGAQATLLRAARNNTMVVHTFGSRRQQRTASGESTYAPMYFSVKKR